MYTAPPKNIPSPDRSLAARLLPAGSSRSWEPAYASLELAGLDFGPRMFGWQGIWSSCSRYFAVMEWRHADFAQGPDMHLLVVDVALGRECVIERVRNGFVEPMYISGGVLRYNKMEHGISERIVRDRSITEVNAWRPVAASLPLTDGGAETVQQGQATVPGNELLSRDERFG